MINERNPVSWGDIDGMWEEMGRPVTKDDLTPELTPPARAGQTPAFEALPKDPQLRRIFLGETGSSF
jgi:hypothetical protein